MSLFPRVREGSVDVAIVAAPHLPVWPSPGVRRISQICAEAGLSVGWYGGDSLTPRGVLPRDETGGFLLVEDPQQRLHRISARAIVRFSRMGYWPDPFPGWLSPGLIPLTTAWRLRKEGVIGWGKAVAILGTGNAALRFGSELLETAHVREVLCVESNPGWGGKRYSGWEVERRRFEMLGGKIVEARPVRLDAKAAQVWELRLEDRQGVRIVEVSRVVSAGPFSPGNPVREYPPGALLFDFEQTAQAEQRQDEEGWSLEWDHASLLAVRLVKALLRDTASQRAVLERIQSRAKQRIHRSSGHREEPFAPTYTGKWLGTGDRRRLLEFSGVPKTAHQTKKMASVECVEAISCHLCAEACPEGALSFTQGPGGRAQVLLESKCTGCGACLKACPSRVPVLVHEPAGHSNAKLTLPMATPIAPQAGQGQFATALNRKGDALGSVRVLSRTDEAEGVSLVEVEVPAHLVWEARGLRKISAGAATDESFLASQRQESIPKVEIQLDGEKRWVRDQVPVSLALFETGRNRPEDAGLCWDGSCGLCWASIDGVRKLACQTPTHKGMAIRKSVAPELRESPETGALTLCACLGISVEWVRERLRKGSFESVEAALTATQVASGRCHGQRCLDAFRRLLVQEGIESAHHWVDWRFPMMDWSFAPSSQF